MTLEIIIWGAILIEVGCARKLFPRELAPAGVSNAVFCHPTPHSFLLQTSALGLSFTVFLTSFLLP